MRQCQASRGRTLSKGTDAAKASRQATGTDAGSRPDPVCFGTRDRPSHLGVRGAESLLSEWHSPSRRSAGQPAGAIEERRSDAGATLMRSDGCWRHHLGGGADQPPPVRTQTRQSRFWPTDAAAGAATVPRDERTRSNARLAGSSRRERANGIGSGNAQPRPQSGKKRDNHWLVPPAHGGASGIFGRSAGRGLRHRLRCTEVASRLAIRSADGAGLGRLPGASEHCLGGVRQRASASRTISEIVLRHGRRRWRTTTAGRQRPQ